MAIRLAPAPRDAAQFHPENGYGAQAFRPDAIIVYTRVQRDELSEKRARYIDLFRRTQSAAAAAALDGT